MELLLGITCRDKIENLMLFFLSLLSTAEGNHHAHSEHLQRPRSCPSNPGTHSRGQATRGTQKVSRSIPSSFLLFIVANIVVSLPQFSGFRTDTR